MYFKKPSNERQFNVQDDHVPFQRRGVRIVHLIAIPFPETWHHPSDNRESINWKDTLDVSDIVRVFVASYLHLQPETSSVSCSRS